MICGERNCNWCYICRNIIRKRGWIWCVISTHLPAKVSCVAGSIWVAKHHVNVNSLASTQQDRFHTIFGFPHLRNKSSFSPLDSFHPAHLGIKKVFFHLLDPTWMAEDMPMKRFLPKRTCFGAFSRSTCIYVYKGFRANKLSGHPHSSGAEPSWVFTPFESNLQIVLTTNDSSNVILGNSDL